MRVIVCTNDNDGDNYDCDDDNDDSFGSSKKI